ncbi:taurine dioxygenase [Allostella vacuolata]|nr:taurine dioxygenase [Stella vacuolata]
MATIGIRRLSNGLGAEITGVDLRQPVDDSTFAAVEKAWHDHLVLLFRGQDITPDQHIAFSRRLGELDQHGSNPRYRLDDYPEILQITNLKVGGKPSDTRNTGRNWHSDLSYTRHPAKGSLLNCRQKPDVGGDTMFTNMYMAYETLSERMKAILEDLWAVHDVSLVAGIGERDPEKTAEMKRLSPPVAHPVVRVHPDTGRKALFVSQRVRSFVGMTEAESRPILDFLCDHATSHEFVYRHQWQVHDLLMWDNRCTMHLALADFDQSQPRHMLRTTLLGEPIGRLYNEAQAA